MIVRTQNKAKLSQGDIFRDIEMVEWIRDDAVEIVVSRIVFPLVIVLTQDCDLDQDYTSRWSHKKTATEDKKIFSVLVSPLYNAEQVYQGKHLEDLGQAMQVISKNRTPGKTLRNNETPRYHYLEFPDHVPIVESVVDFKHYFSVNVETLKRLKRTRFVCKVGELYREDISQRFASYLSRIGLP
jgi:hypothetical protein